MKIVFFIPTHDDMELELKWEYASNFEWFNAEFVSLETKLKVTHVLISRGDG